MAPPIMLDSVISLTHQRSKFPYSLICLMISFCALSVTDAQRKANESPINLVNLIKNVYICNSVAKIRAFYET